MVLATAAASAAYHRWGAGCLDVVVKQEWAPLWHGHPAVRELLPWDARDRGPLGVLQWAGKLRGRGYSAAFDLQGSPRTRALLLAAGIHEVGRPDRQGRARRRLVRTHTEGPPDGFHMARAFRDVVDPQSSCDPVVRPSEAAQTRAAELIPGAGDRVGLVPGARHATKRWPLERYLALARALNARGLGPVPVFFGPGEEALQASWTAQTDSGSSVVLCEDLSTVAACLARLRRVVTNDTGLMHLCAAVGTPVVAMFGPTVRSFGFTPVGEGHRVLEVSLSCRPCSLHGGPTCPETHFRCLNDISVAQAMHALDLAGS